MFGCKKVFLIFTTLMVSLSCQIGEAKVSDPEYVYKIMSSDEWVQQSDREVYSGNDWDKQDGFIHLSTANQVEKTAKKYYKDVANPILLKLCYEDIAKDIKWEENSKGELFPHAYHEIRRDAFVKVIPISLNDFDFSSLDF